MIYIYDSVYESVDNVITRNILQSLFEVNNNFKITMALDQKQEKGSNNCGLFAVATATTIALKFTTLCIKYKECYMRKHFCNCLERHVLSMFP